MHKSRVGEITLRSSSAVQHRHANEGSESAWLSRRTARDQSISRDIAITNPRHQPPAATRHSRGISLTTIYSPAATTNSSVKRPSSSPSPLSASRTPLVDSYFSLQPASSGIEARSPANKRPPASRSSYGIETSSGPPPALSTQRTYSKESIWRLPSTNETAVDYSLLSPRILATLGPSSTTTGVAVSAGTIISTNTSLDEPSALLSTASINPENPTALLAVSDMVQKASQSEDGRQFASDDEGDRTLRASDDMEQSHNNGQQTVQTKGMHNGGKEQSQSSEEDIFLNLARAGEVVTEMTDVPGQSERRHVSDFPMFPSDVSFNTHHVLLENSIISSTLLAYYKISCSHNTPCLIAVKLGLVVERQLEHCVFVNLTLKWD
ncbi:hypothetical protein MMC06_002878 [Schaereria dolodes]|nr:hypothetical protein [Schaereria dolodes]